MRRRTLLGRLAVGALLLIVALFMAGPSPGIADEAVCPRCGAPLEPGAQFCGRCGARIDKPVPVPVRAAVPDTHSAVVQVVTAHDNELTSTYASLAYQSNIKVDSILGSAFAIAPGEFLTDSGLLVGAKEVSLRTSTGRSAPARVIGSDPMIGVALLQADLKDVAILPLRNADAPRIGENLDALGFPSGMQATAEPVVSAGVVSGLHRGAAGIHPIEDYLQTDASLPRGLAGGPMLDDHGRVVGMSTGLVLGSRVFLGQAGIGYAVPAEWVARALAWIRAGAAPRLWIGAFAVTADAERREKYKLPPQVKLVIEQVFPGSPGASAGLRRGDGLVTIEGEEISGLVPAQRRFLEAKGGAPIALEVLRGAEPVRISVTPVLRPDRPRLSGIDALRFFGDVEIVPHESDHLVVGTVAPGSELSHSKVEAGDILQSILSKKDWLHGAKDNSRWRSVRTVADLEERIATAYSDLDFCLGLRFKGKDGTKRELFLWEILTPTGAL